MIRWWTSQIICTQLSLISFLRTKIFERNLRISFHLGVIIRCFRFKSLKIIKNIFFKLLWTFNTFFSIFSLKITISILIWWFRRFSLFFFYQFIIEIFHIFRNFLFEIFLICYFFFRFISQTFLRWMLTFLYRLRYYVSMLNLFFFCFYN